MNEELGDLWSKNREFLVVVGKVTVLVTGVECIKDTINN